MAPSVQALWNSTRRERIVSEDIHRNTLGKANWRFLGVIAALLQFAEPMPVTGAVSSVPRQCNRMRPARAATAAYLESGDGSEVELVAR